MAKCEALPVVPAPAAYTLDLTKDEAEALHSVLCQVAVAGPGEHTYQIFKALGQAQVPYRNDLEPYLRSDGLIRFR